MWPCPVESLLDVGRFPDVERLLCAGSAFCAESFLDEGTISLSLMYRSFQEETAAWK